MGFSQTTTLGGGAVDVPTIKTYPPPTTWTVPDDFAAADTVRIYVDSSAANDSANGLTDTTPKKTIAAGRALLPPGTPGQLLLKCGGIWTDESLGYWSVDGSSGGSVLSGRNQNERMVIGTYGVGARPRVKSGIIPTFRTSNVQAVQHLAILCIDFDCHTFAGNNNIGCVEIGGGFQNILIEGCLFRKSRFPFYVKFLASTPTRDGLILRKNVFQDAQGTNASHISIYRADNVLIEGNFLDNMLIQTASVAQFCHSIMCSWDCTGVTVRNNVISRAANKAIWLACGGVCRGNVAIKCGGGIQIGNSFDAANQPTVHAKPGGVPCSLIGNLVIESKDITGDTGSASGGHALHLENVVGGEVAQNLVTQSAATQTPGWSVRAISVSGAGNTSAGAPTACRNVVVRENKVVRWMSGTGFQDWAIALLGANAGGVNRLEAISLSANEIQEPNGTTGFLARIDSQSAYPQITSSGNKFWRAGGTGDWFFLVTLTYPLTGNPSWQSILGDTTSTAELVSYPFATRTIGDYNASLGGTNSTQAFIDACMAQTPANWDTSLEAQNVLAYFNGNLQAATTGQGATDVGPADPYTPPVPPVGGWTTFSTTGVIWYVDSTRPNDTGNGLTEGAAFQTLNAAKIAADAAADANNYNGNDNWILLKSGQTFAPPNSNNLKKLKGVSAARPFLIGTWGPLTGEKNIGPRATIEMTQAKPVGFVIMGGGSGPTDTSNLALFNLAFTCPTYDGTFETRGIYCVYRATNLLIEGCKFSGMFLGATLMGHYSGLAEDRLVNARFRRCICVDAWSNLPGENGKSQGLYADFTEGLLLEGSVFDHNGWKVGDESHWDIYAHNVYLQTETFNTTVRHCIFSDASSHGIQMRGGGICRHNLFLRNPIAATLGSGSTTVPTSIEVYGNVVFESRDTHPTNQNNNLRRGWGFEVSNVDDGFISYNLFAKNHDGWIGHGIQLYANGGSGEVIRNLSIDHNRFYDWKAADHGVIALYGVTAMVSGNTLELNEFVNTAESDALFFEHSDADTWVAADLVASTNKFWRSTAGNGKWFDVAGAQKTTAEWQVPLGTGNTNALTAYTDTARTIATYMTFIGGTASTNAFILGARANSKNAWDEAYTAGDLTAGVDESTLLAYLRAGWDLVLA